MRNRKNRILSTKSKLFSHISNLILILLIFSSVFLAVEIWQTKKLWPEGYNFFSSWEQITWINSILQNMSWRQTPDMPTSEQYVKYNRPSRIILNKNASHAVYDENSKYYNEYYPVILETFKNLFSGTNTIQYTAVNESEWINALKSRSVYFEYPSIIHSKVAAQFLGSVDNPPIIEMASFNEVIIVPNENFNNEMWIFLKDTKTDKVGKFSYSADLEPILTIINDSVNIDIKKYAFAYELNLNNSASQTDEMTPKPVFNPTVFFPLDTMNTPTIKTDNPLKIEPNQTGISPQAERILKTFSYNTKVIRQYTETDDTQVFVDNYSTLKVSPMGLIEYKALDNASGLKLTGEKKITETNSAYESTSGILNLVTSLCADMNMNDPSTSLKITSEIPFENKDNEIVITLDYVYEGMDIETDIPNYKDSKPIKHAVTASMRNGHLKSFTFFTRSFEKDKPEQPNEPLFPAMDRYFNQNTDNPGQIYINKALLQYKIDTTNAIRHTEWKLITKQ